MSESWNPTDDEYYSCHDWLSHSEWKLFHSSPRTYERHVIKGVPFKRNASMEFGTSVDDVTLDAAGFAANIVIIPDEVLGKGGIRSGRAYKEFEAANAGKKLVKRDDPLNRVIESLRDHKEAFGILDALGDSQVAIRWESEVDGKILKRRAKLDKVPTGMPFLADLKTTRDPRDFAFARQIIDLKYHTQAVWYQDAIESKYGVRPPFIIVAVQNCEPYECCVYELDERFIALGRQTIDKSLIDFVRCREAGSWRMKTHNTIIRLSPPGWAEAALREWNFADEAQEETV